MKYFQLITVALFLFSFSACRDANQYLTGKFIAFFKDVDLESAKKLLEEGADPNAEINDDGTTVLMQSSLRGYSDFVETLLSQGADPDKQNKHGSTALIYICKVDKAEGQLIIVKELLVSKANPDIQDQRGKTALIYASKFGRATVVQALLDAGADPNIPDKEGWTALMRASQQGHLEVVRILLEDLADKDLKNNQGETASDLVKKSLDRPNSVRVDQLLLMLK